MLCIFLILKRIHLFLKWTQTTHRLKKNEWWIEKLLSHMVRTITTLNRKQRGIWLVVTYFSSSFLTGSSTGFCTSAGGSGWDASGCLAAGVSLSESS